MEYKPGNDCTITFAIWCKLMRSGYPTHTRGGGGRLFTVCTHGILGTILGFCIPQSSSGFCDLGWPSNQQLLK